MKIVIAYDGSDSAKEAIEDLRFAGLHDDTEALILTVTETWLPTNDPKEDALSELLDDEIKWPWRNTALKKIAQSEKLALAAWGRLREIFPQWQIRHEIVGGYPEWAITGKAKRIRHDLIVVGSEGQSKVGRFVLGSVALKVLSEAICSVRVGRPASKRQEDDGSPLRLIVGFDGSPDSQLAIESIVSRNWPSGTEVTVVSAVEPAERSGGEEPIDDPEELQRPAIDLLKDSGLSASSVVRPGRAKEIILEEAEGRNADTVFLGAKGHRFLERMLLGSVSYSVTARARCSVEVVRSI